MTNPIPDIFNGWGGTLPLEPMLKLIIHDATVAAKNKPDDRGLAGGRNINLQALSDRVGIDDKVFRRLLSGKSNNITLDVADRYLCATGRHLRDVYPWLYTPEQIQADIDAVDNECPDKRAKRLRQRARDASRQERWKALTS